MVELEDVKVIFRYFVSRSLRSISLVLSPNYLFPPLPKVNEVMFSSLSVFVNCKIEDFETHMVEFLITKNSCFCGLKVKSQQLKWCF